MPPESIPVSAERMPSRSLQFTVWSPIQNRRADRGLRVKAARWKSTTSGRLRSALAWTSDQRSGKRLCSVAPEAPLAKRPANGVCSAKSAIQPLAPNFTAMSRSTPTVHARAGAEVRSMSAEVKPPWSTR